MIFIVSISDINLCVSHVILSCLKVILDILEKLSKPGVNSLLHEFGFQVWNPSWYLFVMLHISFYLWWISLNCFVQLLYELCLDPLTCGPTMDLLSNKKYQFFVKVQYVLLLMFTSIVIFLVIYHSCFLVVKFVCLFFIFYFIMTAPGYGGCWTTA